MHASRALRVGFPEVVFGQGKTAEQIVVLAERLNAAGSNLLVTRLPAEVAEEVVRRLPGSAYDPVARTLTRRIAEYQTVYGPQHPKVIQAQAELASVRGRFLASTQSFLI